MKKTRMKTKAYLNWVLESWHWPYQRTNSNGVKEFSCPHGIGHGGIHGCDGCCHHKSYKQALKAYAK